MAWYNWIGQVFQGGKDVAEVFVENKENKGKRTHKEKLADVTRDMASLQQFSDEFHIRKNRTWWDSFIDGLNRLPRPLITISILSFFVLAPMNPIMFLEIAKAYELMPAGYWALLSIIVGFYFGGRMQLKSQDMTIRQNVVQTAKDLILMKEEFRKLHEEDESSESKIFDSATGYGQRKIKNKVLETWLKDKSI
jgi:hypothetical protein